MEMREVPQPVMFPRGGAGDRRAVEPRLAQVQCAQLQVAFARFSCRGPIGTVELRAGARDMIKAIVVLGAFL